ncbi:MAG: hypothetical protein NVSMB57_07650 [Actinomycetota bacterium]
MVGSRTKTVFAVLVGFASFGGIGRATPVSAADPTLIQHVRQDADWLIQASASDGAIGTWIDREWVVPYRSNFAAMGLARATSLTGDARYAKASWRWLSWYQDHMDTNGFITDYQRSGSGWRSTGTMDSTDAYASTFLMALRETLDATGDIAQLGLLRAGYYKAINALAATQDSDGLHFAKPGWPFKYVMDDSENYSGLRAASYLASVLGDKATQRKADADASKIKASFSKLFNATQHGYDWALNADGTRATLNWGELYPSAVAQAWAVAFGVVEGDDARALFSRFDQSQPWDQPAATIRSASGPVPVGYWPVGAIAALRAGEPARAERALRSIRDAAAAKSNFWPFTTAESGELIMLETDGRVSPAPFTASPNSVPNPPALAIPRIRIYR